MQCRRSPARGRGFRAYRAAGAAPHGGAIFSRFGRSCEMNGLPPIASNRCRLSEATSGAAPARSAAAPDAAADGSGSPARRPQDCGRRRGAPAPRAAATEARSATPQSQAPDRSTSRRRDQTGPPRRFSSPAKTGVSFTTQSSGSRYALLSSPLKTRASFTWSCFSLTSISFPRRRHIVGKRPLDDGVERFAWMSARPLRERGGDPR